MSDLLKTREVIGRGHQTDDWTRAIFAELQTNIRWAKDRMIAIVQWTLLLLGALVALAASEPAIGPPWLLAFAVALPLLSGLWVKDLHCFARGTRCQVDAILDESAHGAAERYPKRRWDRHHVCYLVILLLVLVAAGSLATLAVHGSSQG